MSLLIAGGRDFTDKVLLCSVIDAYRTRHKVRVIVSGGARGADRLGECYARKHGIALRVIKPDWQRHGRGAGLLRNQELVDAAEHVICFWDGKSRGTQDTVTKARRANKLYEVVSYGTEIKKGPLFL